jgi:hypothetical protein
MINSKYGVINKHLTVVVVVVLTLAMLGTAAATAISQQQQEVQAVTGIKVDSTGAKQEYYGFS